MDVLLVDITGFIQFIRFRIWDGHDKEDASDWASSVHAQLTIRLPAEEKNRYSFN